MTQVAPGRWLCEWCSAWVCTRCGKLDQERDHPVPDHYLKRYRHQYGCTSPSSEPTSFHFTQDDLGFNVAQRRGATQCLTCQKSIANRAVECNCCGENHNVTKDGVKVEDYLGTGSHMRLILGKWYCEFCIVAICSRCGKAVIESQNACKDRWAHSVTHNGNALPECNMGLAGNANRFYFPRADMVNKARNRHTTQCATCQSNLDHKRLPLAVLDPKNVSLTTKAKKVYGVVKQLVNLANAINGES